MITSVTTWKPADVSPLTGTLNTLGSGVNTVVDAAKTLANTAAGLIRIAASLVPSSSDPAVAVLEASLNSLQGVINQFTFVEAELSLLLVPPVQDFFSYINQKLADTSDLRRPDEDGDHYGIVIWATSEDPTLLLSQFKSLQNIFGNNRKKQSNAVGFNLPRPVCKVFINKGFPTVRWAYPHPFELASQVLPVRDASGNEYSKIQAIRDVKVIRRKKPARGTEETELTSFEYAPGTTSYQDTAISNGRYEYSVSFDYVLANGKRIQGVRSNWVGINVSRAKRRKQGSFPQFVGVNASQSIEGLNIVTEGMQEFITGLAGRSSDLSAELTAFADFIDKYAESLSTQITQVTDTITKIVSNLDVLARAGLNFAAYEGSPSASISEIASQAPLTSPLSVGLYVDASNEGAISALKGLLGLGGGSFKPVDALGKAARDIQKTGASVVENVKNQVNSTTNALSKTFE